MSEPKGPQLPMEVITKFLDVQAREVVLKENEMALRKQELDSQHQIALAAIQAQSSTQESSRSHDHKMWKSRYWFIGGLVFILASSAVILVLVGAKDIVTDTLKIFSGVAAGGFGGYFAGKNQAEKKNDD